MCHMHRARREVEGMSHMIMEAKIMKHVLPRELVEDFFCLQDETEFLVLRAQLKTVQTVSS